MTDQEIEECRQRLVGIQVKSGNGQFKDLQKLAKELGASTIDRYKGYGDAGQAELTENIHQALQTASMINMSKTAAKNYEIAVTATKAAVKNYWIAAAIAFLSMLAAWAAVFVIVLTG